MESNFSRSVSCGGDDLGQHMHDDDAGDLEQAGSQTSGGLDGGAAGPDLFGDYSVIGPGVDIMLDGRQVSCNWR